MMHALGIKGTSKHSVTNNVLHTDAGVYVLQSDRATATVQDSMLPPPLHASARLSLRPAASTLAGRDVYREEEKAVP